MFGFVKAGAEQRLYDVIDSLDAAMKTDNYWPTGVDEQEKAKAWVVNNAPKILHEHVKHAERYGATVSKLIETNGREVAVGKSMVSVAVLPRLDVAAFQMKQSGIHESLCLFIVGNVKVASTHKKIHTTTYSFYFVDELGRKEIDAITIAMATLTGKINAPRKRAKDLDAAEVKEWAAKMIQNLEVSGG